MEKQNKIIYNVDAQDIISKIGNVNIIMKGKFYNTKNKNFFEKKT